jgi:succinoglycan biosynthesis protein ExoA
MSIPGITFTRPTSHRARFAAFSVIGAFVFWVGIGLQVLLTGDWHVSAIISFIVQGVVSVELSFLANRHWTWRVEPVPFWRGWRRFNGQKIITMVANLAVYVVLLRLGVNYLAANVATTALFTVVNYAAAHYWAFRPGRSARTNTGRAAASSGWPAVSALGGAGQPGRAPSPPSPPAAWRTASVVVPCRGNERTIRATVDSLLEQDYPGLTEVILVGSAGDTTWQALRDIADPRLVLMEREETPGLRDSNAKRDLGIQRATGDVLALADSDIVLRPDWLRRGLSLLAASGASCAAGGMSSIHDSFFGRFVEGTRMGAKTPRVPQTYVVTRENFGRRGRKPPVTANVIFTRELYDDCQLDVGWGFGYEDYEWFWRMARAGHRILFSSELCGQHHHRRSLRQLCWEYLRSGDGCGRFVRRHPDCPLARKRLLQAILLPVIAMAVAAADVGAAAVTGQLTPLLAAGVLAAAAAAWECAHQRRPEALLYPLLNGILGSVFLFALVRGILGVARTTTPLPKSRAGRSAIRPALAGALAAEEAR